MVGALTVGFAMFGAGVHGLAGVDARLEAATERQRENHTVKYRYGDCPREGERDGLPERDGVSERERL
jgi:hypothetical protein